MATSSTTLTMAEQLVPDEVWAAVQPLLPPSHLLAAATGLATRRRVGRPVISLRTDDCQRDAERLKARGVVFVREPGRMAYGGMDAVFDDTCGNLISLHQD
jgi:predicted enzyme related to lactoylglutathione lyase